MHESQMGLLGYAPAAFAYLIIGRVIRYPKTGNLCYVFSFQLVSITVAHIFYTGKKTIGVGTYSCYVRNKIYQ